MTINNNIGLAGVIILVPVRGSLQRFEISLLLKRHTMAFLRDRPKVALSEPDKQSKYHCFAADLHQTALPHADIEANMAIFSQFEQHVQKYMHKKLRLDFVGAIADTEGLLLIVRHSKMDTLQNVRSGVINMMAQIPTGQMDLLKNTFRVIDQIDADRIDTWVS